MIPPTGGETLTRLLSRAYGPLTGKVSVPGDKSISHRAALFGLIAGGPSRATGWLDCQDTRSSLAAVQALGAKASVEDGVLEIVPPGAPPRGPVTINCDNSGTTARLLMGLLAGWLPAGGPPVVLTGDASLSRRPMNRVVAPLRSMGADITWLETDGRLPVKIRGAQLVGFDHQLPVASAQVKSALLLAGLFARGRTTVAGAGGSRDHTELFFHTMGIDCQDDPVESKLLVTGPVRCGTFDVKVPGDPSSAAFFQVAAALVPGSDVVACGQSINYTRTGALRILRRAGVRVTIERPSGPPGGEPGGDVRVAHNLLQKFIVEGPEIPAVIDEIPVLAVMATQCAGETIITGAGELRVKESDRLAVVTENLKRLGADVVELEDGLKIAGPTLLVGGEPDKPLVLKTAGDHRVAMAMAIAALVTKGETALDEDACVAVSYPYFFQSLEMLL